MNDEELDLDTAAEAQVTEAQVEGEESPSLDLSIQKPNPPANALEEIIDNLAVNAADLGDNLFQGNQRTKDEIAEERGWKRDDFRAKQDQFKENLRGTGTQEVSNLLTGGAIDAVESVGAIAELTGDQIKTGFNQTFGFPVDPTQDPSDPEYIKKDAGWLQVPDEWEPENETGWGRFGREIVEFGLISRHLRQARVGVGLHRAAGAGQTGNRVIEFFRIGADGALAEFITEDSELGNIANALQEWLPDLAPGFVSLFAVHPDDNPWLARFKTTATGSGFNYIGHTIGALGKAAWGRGRDLINVTKAKGKKITRDILDKANELANEDYAKEIAKANDLDEQAATELAAQRYVQGKGISNADPRDEFRRSFLNEEEYKELSQLLESGTGTETIENIARTFVPPPGKYGKGKWGYAPVQFETIFDELAWYIRDGKPKSKWPKTSVKFIPELEKQGFNLADVRAHGAKIHERIKGISKQQTGSGAAGANTRGYEFNIPDQGFKGATQSIDNSARINELDELANSRGAEAGNVWDENRGISNVQLEDYSNRSPDPFVNPNQYSDIDRATYRPEPDGIEKSLKEIASSLKNGGDGKSGQVIATESQISAIARGDLEIDTVVRKVIDRMADMKFQKPGGQENYDVMIKNAHILAKPLLDAFKIWDNNKRLDLTKLFKESMAKSGDTLTHTFRNGTVLSETIGPTQRNANIIMLNSLSELVNNLAKAGDSLSSKAATPRQWEMILDAMEVLLIENKRLGMSWSLTGHEMKSAGFLTKAKLAAASRSFDEMEQKTHQLFNALRDMAAQGRFEEIAFLQKMFRLTDGQVMGYNDLTEYLWSRLAGGRMMDQSGQMVPIHGRMRKEIVGHYLNSMLTAPITGVKAVLSTNLLAIARPLQTALGSVLPHRLLIDKLQTGKSNGFWRKHLIPKSYESVGGDFTDKELGMALVQLDSISKSWVDAWKVAKKDLDTGFTGWKNPDKIRKQMYTGKFDLELETKQFKDLREVYQRHPNPFLRAAYNLTDLSVNVTTNPVYRYNQIFMGAGDAAARTLIGRQRMYQEAAIDALSKGADLKDLKQIAHDTAQNFENKIFKTGKNGEQLVSDEAAMIAGDRAALTTPLTGNLKGFQALSNLPFVKTFMPWVKPFLNGVSVIFDYTPLVVFKEKYNDIVIHGRNLEAHGLTPETLPAAVREMEGAIAMGTMISGMGWLVAMSGGLTGSMPHDPEERRLWKLNRVQPNSFVLPKPGGGKVYFSFQNLEIFKTLFSMQADIVYYQDILGEDITDQWASKLPFMFGALIYEGNPVLSGAEGLVDILDSSSGEEALKRFTAKTARAHLPASAFSNAMGKLIDANEKEAEGFWEMMWKRDAFIKSTLPAKYDILSKDRSGKKYIYGAHNPILKMFNTFSPIAITTTEGDPLKEKLLEIRYPLSNVVTTIDGEELTSQERSDLSKILSMSPSLRPSLAKVMRPGSNFDLKYQEYTQLDLKERDNWPLSKLYFEIDQVFLKEKALARAAMKRNSDKNDPDSLINRIHDKKRKSNALKTGNLRKIKQLSKHGN